MSCCGDDSEQGSREDVNAHVWVLLRGIKKSRSVALYIEEMITYFGDDSGLSDKLGLFQVIIRDLESLDYRLRNYIIGE